MSKRNGSLVQKTKRSRQGQAEELRERQDSSKCGRVRHRGLRTPLGNLTLERDVMHLHDLCILLGEGSLLQDPLTQDSTRVRDRRTCTITCFCFCGSAPTPGPTPAWGCTKPTSVHATPDVVSTALRNAGSLRNGTLSGADMGLPERWVQTGSGGIRTLGAILQNL